MIDDDFLALVVVVSLADYLHNGWNILERRAS
jgi:hypothetical protein